MNGEAARRPGGTVRLLLLALTGAGFLAVFSVGFPPAARDRLPVLVLAVGLALLSAWNPSRGLTLFSFLFPLAGLGDRVFGGGDAIAWPLLLFGGFAAGWTFRFLYDFESAPDPSRADSILRALAALWSAAAILAAVRARTLWAAWHGLGLRSVNVEGLLDTAAIRESVIALAVLGAGAGYFFLLRRAGKAARERALSAALSGAALSAAAAVAQRLGMAPAETSAYWKLTGRLSGGAIDPNSLGLLCGLAAVAALGWLLSGSPRRNLAAALLLPLALGLVLSGSRSGLAAASIGTLALVLAPGAPPRRRLAVAVVALGVLLALGVRAQKQARGTVGARLAQIFDPRLPIEYRVSARPLLWESALRLFLREPMAGAGLGAFSWQLPNLLSEQGRALPMRDNPGNAYLQALAETGAVGFLLTLVFAGTLARETWARRRAGPADATLSAAAAAALLAFLVSLVAGSHWFASDVSLFFFLLAAIVARPSEPARSLWPRRIRRLAVAVYVVGAAREALSTLSPQEAFRYRQGMGFHAREIGPGGPFYWTERRFAIRLAPGETMRIVLAHYTPEGRPVGLVADSGGRRVFESLLEPGRILPLRLAGGAEPRVVRFTLSRAFVPKRLGLSADRRELGLMAIFPRGIP